MTNEN